MLRLLFNLKYEYKDVCLARLITLRQHDVMEIIGGTVQMSKITQNETILLKENYRMSITTGHVKTLILDINFGRKNK